MKSSDNLLPNTPVNTAQMTVTGRRHVMLGIRLLHRERMTFIQVNDNRYHTAPLTGCLTLLEILEIFLKICKISRKFRAEFVCLLLTHNSCISKCISRNIWFRIQL